MATIYIANDHKDLAERLARNTTSIAGKSVFPTYMHLMVFAAMVGYSAKRSAAVDPKNKGPEIYEEVFARAKLDGLPFLLALDAEKNAEILRENRETECWKIIESYAEGGFQIIQQWLLDRPGDIDGVETILARISETASVRFARRSESLDPDVSF